MVRQCKCMLALARSRDAYQISLWGETAILHSQTDFSFQILKNLLEKGWGEERKLNK